MHPDMRLGAPTLRVLDLKDTLEFYRGAFGLTVSTEYLAKMASEFESSGFPRLPKRS